MALKVAELEMLFTANTDPVAKAEKQVIATAKKIESKPVKIDADAKPALDGMDRVENAAKQLVSKDTALKLDADITRAEKSLERTKQRLEDLQVRALGGLDVTADVKRAEAQLNRTQRTLDGLVKARNVIEVQADTSDAESALDGVSDAAGEAGEDSGQEFGKSILAALATIPIAGAVIGIGVAAGKALIDGLNDGLQVEVGFDRLEALTGISEAAALRLGRAAGESYANNFGESIESNMDTTRLALQFDIIDEKATTRDAQKVVEGLSGIADVLGEDVQPVARAVTTMLRTGLAKSADEAFDILAAGARNGVNVAEDLLDTLTEYPTHFRDLGLSGEEALGLLNQGLNAGARDSDKVADALKELTVRVKDVGDEASNGALAELGLDAEEMARAFAEGGPAAREGLEHILTGLQDVEDPAARSRLALALFGTQSEDMAQALGALDLSTAVAQLDGVEGAAQRMFDTLTDNDASKIQRAQRNIEVAMDGIKGALAGAFSEPLGDLADWVSSNRGPLLQFFSDLVNGAIDFGITANESFGSFVAGPLADIVDGMKHVIKIMNPFADTSDLENFIDGMRDFEDQTDKVTEGLEGMRDKFNGFAEGQIALGHLNDASLRTVDAISKVGVAADGTKLSLSGVDTANLAASESGARLKAQLDASVQAFESEIETARLAGESQENLTDRYNTTRGALIEQMTAMGLTEEQAQSLIDTVLKTPEEMETEFSSNADSERGKVERLGNKIVTLPDGSSVITAHTSGAQRAVDNFIIRNNGREIRVKVAADGGSINMGSYRVDQAAGGLVEFMAAGGLRGLNPMAPLAQTVPPNTWRVVGDRSDVPEAYIPLDGSARSMAILMETIRRMPGLMPMADGGVLGSGSVPSQQIAGLQIGGRLALDADGFVRLIGEVLSAELPSAGQVASELPFH